MKSHRLIIQGREYIVRSDASDQYMFEVAKLVEQSMEDARKAGVGPQQVAVYAALNLAGEIVDRDQRFERWKQAFRSQLAAINTLIDKALDKAAGSGNG